MTAFNLTAKVESTYKELDKLFKQSGVGAIYNTLKYVDPGGNAIKYLGFMHHQHYCSACNVPYTDSVGTKLCPVCGTSNNVADLTVAKCKEFMSSVAQKCRDILAGTGVTAVVAEAAEVVAETTATREPPPLPERNFDDIVSWLRTVRGGSVGLSRTDIQIIQNLSPTQYSHYFSDMWDIAVNADGYDFSYIPPIEWCDQNYRPVPTSNPIVSAGVWETPPTRAVEPATPYTLNFRRMEAMAMAA